MRLALRAQVVEIDDAALAAKAIAALNGKTLGGRALKVNEAKPLEPRSGGGGGGDSGFSAGAGGAGGDGYVLVISV